MATSLLRPCGRQQLYQQNFLNMNTNILTSLCASLIVLAVRLNASCLAAGHSNNETRSALITENIQADDPNSAADNIIGTYLVDHKGEKSKVKVFRNSDGSYTAQVFWVRNRTEKDGSVRKDVKNPDKSLRNVDCDKIVIFKGLKYDSSSKTWSGTSIYDPVRGLNASLKVWFKDSKTLALKGSKMGFSETVYWTVI